MTLPETSRLPGIELLAAFNTFPLAMALVDTDGITQLVNEQFRARFGDTIADRDAVRLIATGGGDRASLTLAPATAGQHPVPALALRTPNGLLVMADSPLGEATSPAMLGLRRRVDDLERLVATDHLTGAWNRAHLDRLLKSEMERSASQQHPLSLVLLDIDHFKSINDRFGHATGDAVLCEMVGVLTSHVRGSDLLFRWGGEEFAVLVAGAGYRSTERVAEGLREAVASHAFAGAGKITLSAGVAEHLGAETAADWFKRVDAALYSAKAGGRNRVCVDRQGDSDTWGASLQSAQLHLTWHESYESGHATIDQEHQELFRLANLLIDAAAAAEPDLAACNRALETLLGHVLKHFSDEEALLEEAHYGQLAAHRRAHGGLVRRALALQAGLQSGRTTLGSIVEFLAQEVVSRHMLVVDKAFFPLFQPGSV